jgi:2,3-bisphosphoglycerate-dependent phosphoglycerate mutase
MQLYFIRHGQSENNRIWALTGTFEERTEDPELTEVGRQQAQHLAEFLARPGIEANTPYDVQNVSGFRLSHLYCSLMIRAVATGSVLARVLGLPLVAWVDIHEVGGINHLDKELGDRHGLPGPNRAFFERNYPELIVPDWLGDEGWWNRPFESREEGIARSLRFLDELLERHGGTEDRIALISHGGFGGHFLRTLLGVPEELRHWISFSNAGITRIDFNEDRAWLCYANRVDFLPPELIT